MHEVFRWPDLVTCDHNTAKVNWASIMYTSWSQPMSFTSQIVNCILAPAVARRILAIRMMIVKRMGTTTNPCRFTLRIIDVDTGTMISQLPTTPSALDPMNLSLFPLLTWQTVYQAVPASSAPIVNTNEYLGVVFTGVAGTNSASNNLQVHPL